jgi:hypothetical protein
MNDLTNKPISDLATIEDLSHFVLFGREKLTSVKAEIRAIDKLSVAQEVREQKREEALMLSEALLDAEMKIGEMTKEIPKAGGGDRRSEVFKSDTGVGFEKQTKAEVIESLGFNEKQVERFETLADNPDLVEQVKAEARENDDLPTRSAVLSLAKARKERDEKNQKEFDNIDEGYKYLKQLHRAQRECRWIKTDRRALELFAKAVGNDKKETIGDIDEITGKLAAMRSILVYGNAEHFSWRDE